jgi:hypothetical protein
MEYFCENALMPTGKMPALLAFSSIAIAFSLW